MGARIPRRSFLLTAFGAVALSLTQACAPQAPTPKPDAKPAAPAPTFGPAAASAPASSAAQPAAASPVAESKPAAKPDAAIKRGGQLVQAINWTYPTMDPQLSSIQYMVG